MSVQDKVAEIRQLVKLVCEVIPSVVAIIREVIVCLKEIKTV